MRAVVSKGPRPSPEFSVSGRISKPVHEVFEAVADPKHLSGYFTTGEQKNSKIGDKRHDYC